MSKGSFSLGLALFSLSVAADQPLYLDNIVNAEPIHKTPPQYPTQLGRKGQEGWVQLSYVVSADGRVEHVLVEDSSGQRLFEKAAQQAVQQWLFEPARLDGKPVQQCKNGVLMHFAMAKADKGLTRRFAKRVASIQALLKDGELDAAKVQLDLLEERQSWNLNEDAMLWMVKAAYQQAKGDNDQELYSLRRALAYDERLSPEQQTVLRTRRFQLELASNRLSDALSTYRKLAELPAQDALLAQLKPLADKAKAVLDSDTPLAIEAELDGRALWHHGLSRPRFTLVDVEGELASLEVRCDTQHSSYKATPELVWEVPTSWGHCQVYVTGEPNSRFTLVELAPEGDAQKS